MMSRAWLAAISCCMLWACVDGGPHHMGGGEAPGSDAGATQPAMLPGSDASAMLPDTTPAVPPRITEFQLAGVSAAIEGEHITLTLPPDTDVTNLAPTVLYDGESVEPDSGMAQDFTEDVVYTVRAADGVTLSYTVSVTVSAAVPRSDVKDISEFALGDIVGVIDGDRIALTVPYGTYLHEVIPRIEFHGASLAPAAGATVDLTQPVVYTVTAEDGSTRQYTVNLTIAPNTAREITHFLIFGIDADIGSDTILVTLPYGSDPTRLTPTIIAPGAMVEPASGVTQDFTKPLMYTVTAEDRSTRVYRVTSQIALSSDKNIVSCRIAGGAAVVSSMEVRLTLPFGGDVRALAPEIVYSGVSLEPASGSTHDFSVPVLYTVTAANDSKKQYAISASAAATTARGIERFSVLGFDAAFAGEDIRVTVPANANIGALTPQIIHHGASIKPASGMPLNFGGAVTYRLTEVDGSERVYTVRVTRAATNDNALVGLRVGDAIGHVAGDAVTLVLPPGAALSALAPTVNHLGVRIVPLSGTTRDFTKPVTYTVVAADGSKHDYTVTARAAADSEKQLVGFALLGTSASVQGDRISVTVPAGADLRALAPSRLEYIGASIEPAPDAVQDFREPVHYTIHAADGSAATYTVEVMNSRT